MRTIKAWIATNKVGSQMTINVEVEDDATDEEIDEQCWDECIQYLQSGWSEE